VNLPTSLLLLIPFSLLLVSAEDLWAQSCTVDTTPMSFGGLESTPGPAVDSAGSLSINCDAPTSYLISMDAGLNGAGQFITRRMSHEQGSGFLDYNLFRDASRTLIWGDGTGGSSAVQGNSMGAMQTVPFYGRVYAGQNLHPGDYSDVVTVTIDW
jgi:spore coat protein U-like protein